MHVYTCAFRDGRYEQAAQLYSQAIEQEPMSAAEPITRAPARCML